MAVIEITSDSHFGSTVGSAGLAVVDFYATWCGPCKAVAPKIDMISSRYPKVVFAKVDVDKLSSIAGKYNVTAMPTFVILSKGSVLETVTGANPGEVERLIKKHIVKAGGAATKAFSGRGHTLGSSTSSGTTTGPVPIDYRVWLGLLGVFVAYLWFNKSNPAHVSL